MAVYTAVLISIVVLSSIALAITLWKANLLNVRTIVAIVVSSLTTVMIGLSFPFFLSGVSDRFGIVLSGFFVFLAYSILILLVTMLISSLVSEKRANDISVNFKNGTLVRTFNNVYRNAFDVFNSMSGRISGMLHKDKAPAKDVSYTGARDEAGAVGEAVDNKVIINSSDLGYVMDIDVAPERESIADNFQDDSGLLTDTSAEDEAEPGKNILEKPVDSTQITDKMGVETISSDSYQQDLEPDAAPEAAEFIEIPEIETNPEQSLEEIEYDTKIDFYVEKIDRLASQPEAVLDAAEPVEDVSGVTEVVEVGQPDIEEEIPDLLEEQIIPGLNEEHESAGQIEVLASEEEPAEEVIDIPAEEQEEIPVPEESLDVTEIEDETVDEAEVEDVIAAEPDVMIVETVLENIVAESEAHVEAAEEEPIMVEEEPLSMEETSIEVPEVLEEEVQEPVILEQLDLQDIETVEEPEGVIVKEAEESVEAQPDKEGDIDGLINEAFRLKESGDLEGAILHYMYALDKGPSVELVFWVILDTCVLYKEMGQPELAREILESYLEKYGNAMEPSLKAEIEKNLI